MISTFLHLLGYLKYPLYLFGGYFLIRGGITIIQTAQPIVVLAKAPGAEDIGTAFMFIGLGLSAGGLTDPNRDEVIKTPHWVDTMVTVFFCFIGLVMISMFTLGVVSGVLRASDYIALGILTFGFGALSQARQMIERNSLSI